MKHVIIGTAGHVDHGKTALVRALTGVDTDRLAEEKRRGLTIEPGFARLSFADGSFAGVVDVPGHEKFIKNMLAGAGGIDLAMLVVAADEGFMPQTEEHLAILSLLGVRSGLIVLTKCDRVTPDWLAMVRAEAAARVSGTFLEGAEIAEVSAVTGQGIETLRGKLFTLVQRTQEKNVHTPFRMPIDRVFSVDGFGTVATGTLIEGALHRLDEVELLPGGQRAHIRTLQVHGESVDTACAGERVAVNLAGVKRAELDRGCTLVRPESVRLSQMLDVRLCCLRESPRTIANGSRVHFYHGTAARLAKVVLLGCETLAPGESGYAQLRFTEEVAVKCGDRFVVRFYSPLETIGGGVILDEAPVRHKRSDPAVLEVLAARERGGDARVLTALTALGAQMPAMAAMAARLGMDERTLSQELSTLCARGEAAEVLPGRFMAVSVLDALWARCETLLRAYHAQNPLQAGMRTAELRQKLLRAAEPERGNALLALFEAEGRLRRAGMCAALADFRIHYTKRQSALRAELLEIYRGMGLRPERTERVLLRFDTKDRAEAARVLESLLSSGELLPLAPGRCWHRDTYQRVYDTVRAWFSVHGTLALGELRDALETSRDDALLALEYFDRNGLTRREGDVRRPGPGLQ